MSVRSTTTVFTPRTLSTLTRATFTVTSSARLTSSKLRPSACITLSHQSPSEKRQFSQSSKRALRDIFPAPEHNVAIKKTPPAWHHPVYSEEQMRSIQVAHRDCKNFRDYVALLMVRLLRFGADTAMGYSHPTKEAKERGSWLGIQKIKSWLGPSPMTERKWLVRCLFLESVAGVPGMVAGSLRHLRSLRSLNRDNGWIETLLEEAYNERMHLLTFMKLAEPGWFMKMMIIGAQGVFYNGFFLSYLLSPSICHRFVGYLEEEAVFTYSRMIDDIEAGKLPRWQTMQAPDIAITYYNMPEDKRTMRDMLLYIRADEAKHREVNHTLSNLKQNEDPNPFVSDYGDSDKPHPDKGIAVKQTGWERSDVI